MRILNFWHRLHAELAALQAAWRADRERAQQIKYRRALRKRRVVLPRPKPDERSSIEQHRRIVTS